MLFPLLIFLARSYRPPAFTAFVLEQVECRHFAVGSHHLERAFLVVLGRLRNTIQVQRDRSYRTATEPVETLNKKTNCPRSSIEVRPIALPSLTTVTLTHHNL